MKEILKKALIFVLVLLFVFPATPISFAADTASSYSSASSQSNEDEVLNDYGFKFSFNSLEGYSTSNGLVSNSPFGKTYMESFVFQEPFYVATGNKNYIEASKDSKVDVPSDGFEYKEVNALTNGFIVSGTNEKISTANIDYSVTAAGDFSRDTRNDGVAVIFAVGNTSTESAGQDFKIYFSVFDPNSADTPTCRLLCTLPHGIIHKTEDISSLIDIACGNYLPGNENSNGISPLTALKRLFFVYLTVKLHFLHFNIS